MPVNPQITIFLDLAGNLHCEAAGTNGARRKVDLPLDFAKNNPELMAELADQLSAIKNREVAALRDKQTRNISTSISRHGSGLVRQVWHDPELIFNSRYRKHLAGVAGNVSQSKSTAKTKTIDPSSILKLKL